jgi:hypothetical protein
MTLDISVFGLTIPFVNALGEREFQPMAQWNEVALLRMDSARKNSAFIAVV